MSTVIPIIMLTATIAYAFAVAGMYGIGLAALGMLSTLATCLTIDVYGPVCDNAGGIAEMCELHPSVREKTDALDAAGNTTAAIGKGFAIGSATLVGLALFGAFVTRAGLTEEETSILSPMVFACLLLGAMIPYWFTAMTMKSVGVAANAMVKEVGRQFSSAQSSFPATNLAGITDEQVNTAIAEYAAECDKFAKGRKITPDVVKHSAFEANLETIRSGNAPADWRIGVESGEGVTINLIMAKLCVPMNAECIAISTDASLREMVPPAALVMLSPLVTGVLLGTDAVAGLLAGAICSSVQLAISASNAGGAWDNAKKFVEAGEVWLPRENPKTGEPLRRPTDEEAKASTFTITIKAEEGNPDQVIERVKHAKGSELHKAAVTGDTVGDPFKDTSGPALNIVMKLMAILSLVFADFFMAINDGHGLLGHVLPWPRLPEVVLDATGTAL